MLYRGSLHIENDLYHLYFLTVIEPQGAQGIWVLLSEDCPPLPPGVSVLIWFDCFVWGGGHYIYLFTSGSSQTVSKSLEQKRYILVRYLYASPWCHLQSSLTIQQAF